jgi:hypothetical protein
MRKAHDPKMENTPLASRGRQHNRTVESAARVSCSANIAASSMVRLFFQRGSTLLVPASALCAMGIGKYQPWKERRGERREGLWD